MKTLRLITQPILIALLLGFGVRSAARIYAIPSSSMAPTLQPGDHIVVTPYYSATPRRGDVVVFHSPICRDDLLVKRIVAVPGDFVEVRDGAGQIIPADSYFVLGDNRTNSFDSRQWGLLSRNLIVGRARFVLWSSAAATLEPRADAAPQWRSALPSAPVHLQRLLKAIK